MKEIRTAQAPDTPSSHPALQHRHPRVAISRGWAKSTADWLGETTPAMPKQVHGLHVGFARRGRKKPEPTDRSCAIYSGHLALEHLGSLFPGPSLHTRAHACSSTLPHLMLICTVATASNQELHQTVARVATHRPQQTKITMKRLPGCLFSFFEVPCICKFQFRDSSVSDRHSGLWLSAGPKE